MFSNEKNKDLLVCLLESILPYKINEVLYLNEEHFIEDVCLRRKVFGLILETDSGNIQIEINNTFQDYTVRRNTAFILDKYTQIKS